MMMSPTGRGDTWREANEDAMSTGSGNSDSETSNRPIGGGRASSEYIPLRFPHVRIEGKKPKAVITALVLTVVIVAGAAFGTVYFSNGEANGIEHKTERLSDQDHEIVVRDLTDPSDDDTPAHAERRTSSSSYHELRLSSHEIQSDAPVTDSQASQNTTGRSRKKSNRSRNRSQVTHGPRPLPENAQTVPAFSLLYQMKLVHGRIESFVNYTKCEDHDIDNRKLFKGWKAILPVNLTGAGLSPTDHPNNQFVGYGKTKSDARRRAAEIALSTLYHGRLDYSGKEDCTEIDVYCTVEEQQEQGGSGNNVATTTSANATTTTT